jgi:hypothetical protein
MFVGSRLGDTGLCEGLRAGGEMNGQIRIQRVSEVELSCWGGLGDVYIWLDADVGHSRKENCTQAGTFTHKTEYHH